ncbi:MAG TPA: CheR family methyltransferase [Stellaceae bacterium]|nr:CheR family methyltransferase [Stellaceae bacterium]
MTPADFALFARVLKERSGLVVTEEKCYLIDSRLEPVARKHGHASVALLAAALRGGRDAALTRDIVEAMTTNESMFFRDTRPFQQFRSIVLPALLEARAATRQLRIWSAACAAGQEPYSLAMMLAEESARLAGWQVALVASDISGEMVARALTGSYSEFEVQRGLPLKYLVKYFEPDSGRWQLKPEILRMVQFRTVNLLEDLATLGRFDAIFCRNVLLYFDAATKTALLDRLALMLPRDGFLFLGGAETMLGVSDRFSSVADERGLYRPMARAAVAAK